MNVTAFCAIVALSMSFLMPAFASEHMHVNHDHEHTRYQPPRADQNGAEKNTPTPAPQGNTPIVPSGK